jgi:peptide/nickel transport system permease protein
MLNWLKETLIFLVRRLIAIAIVLVGVSTVAFVITRLLGNPVYLLVGQQTDKQIVDNLIHQMGLDQPIYVQYIRYMAAAAHGDLGISRYTYRPVLTEVELRLPATLELVLAAMLITVVVGITLGLLAAVRPGSAIDRFGQFLTQLGVSIPNFWLGLILIYVFFYLIHWFPPPLGRIDSTISPPPPITGLLIVDSLLTGNVAALGSALGHLVLPAITLALTAIPSTLQITRTALIQILSSDYIRTARAYGMPASKMYFVYALKNAVVPIVTMLAMTFGFLMSGTVLVETVFNWPGLGLFAVDSMQHFDYEPIVGVVFLSALFYVLAYLAADIVTFAVDPRIRAQ